MVSSSDIQPLNWLLADWQLNVPYTNYEVAPKVLLFIYLFVLVCLFLFYKVIILVSPFLIFSHFVIDWSLEKINNSPHVSND